MATSTRLSDGGYVETYVGARPDYGSALYVQKYTAGGTPVGPQHILPPSSDSNGIPQVAALSNGGFVVGTVSSAAYVGPLITYHPFSASSEPFPSVQYAYGALAASPEGGFAVASSGAVQRGDPDGPESQIQLHDNNGALVFREGLFTGGAPSVSVLASGDYQFTWDGGRSIVVDPSNPRDLINPSTPSITLIDDVLPDGEPGATNDPDPTMRVTVIEEGTLQYIRPTNERASSVEITTADVARGYIDIQAYAGREGESAFRVRFIDREGLVSGYGRLDYRVDTQVPGAANVIRVLDNQLPVEGEVASGGVTDDRSPTLQFSVPGAQAGDFIQLYSGGQAFGERMAITTTDLGRGYFATTPSLGDGSYSFSAKITDQAGNAGVQAPAFAFTVSSSAQPTTVSISGGGSRAEGNSGSTPFDFVVTRSGDTTLTTLIDYFVIGQTNASDFAGPTSATLTFNPGETSKAITILVAGDTSVEPDESFAVGLSNARGGTIGAGREEATVLNDDSASPPPSGSTVTIVSATPPNSEGTGGTRPFEFTVTRAGDTSGPLLVDYVTFGQEARPPAGSPSSGPQFDATDAADFTGPTAGTLSFQAGETTKTITILVTGDTVAEGNERFVVELSNPRGGSIQTASASGLMYNDDSSPPPAGTQVAVSGGGSKAEGNSGTTPFDFTVARMGDTSGQTLLDYFVIGQTGAADFAGPTTGTVTFNPGETSKAITIVVVGDTAVEPDEAFTLGLSNARGATIGAGRAEATVLNDDGGAPPPPPAGTQVAVSGGASKAEGNSGTTPFDFTVTRAGDTSGATLVDYFVIGQTDAADFAGPTTGTLYFAPGETSKTLTLRVAGDTAVEGDEAFTLGLSNARGGTIAQGQSNAKVLNDDGTSPPPAADGQVLTWRQQGDTLTGGSGADTINASQGPDQLTGNGGGDLFAWAQLPWRAGHVTDFTPGSDKLDLRALFTASGYTGSNPLADGRLEFRSDGQGNTQVYFDRDASGAGDWPFLITTLDRVQAGQIGAGDWLFQ